MYYRYALSALHCFALTIHDMKKQWTIFDLRDVTVVAGKYFNYEEDYFENTYDYREQVSLLIYRYLSVLPYLRLYIQKKSTKVFQSESVTKQKYYICFRGKKLLPDPYQGYFMTLPRR